MFTPKTRWRCFESESITPTEWKYVHHCSPLFTIPFLTPAKQSLDVGSHWQTPVKQRKRQNQDDRLRGELANFTKVHLVDLVHLHNPIVKLRKNYRCIDA